MKDPTVEDPRFVSAYSVYKGLANFKSYEDTSAPSGQTSASKRNKKKARKRNRKDENGELKVDAVAATATKSESKANRQEAGPKNVADKPDQLNGANSGEQVPSSKNKRKKQRKRNKKKVAENASSSDVLSKSALESAICISDDDDEPPIKTRKRNELVPNPLATKKGKDVNKEGHRKNKDLATVGKPVEQISAKKTPSNGLEVNKKKVPEKQTPKIVAPSSSSSSSKAPASNGVSAKKASSKGLEVNKKKATEMQTPKIVAPSSSTSSSSKAPVTNGISTKTPTKSNKKLHQDTVAIPTSSNSSMYTVTSKVPPVDIRSVLTSARIEDSFDHGKNSLQWLLDPVTTDEFMKTYWEKKPLLVKRKHSDAANYYQWILTTQTFDDMLRRNPIKYGVNLDITSYVDGKRETLSETMQGRVRPAVVWDYYNNGCSIRMLNPQTYIQPLWRLNSSLQEFFGSFVGANMYLTPPDSQGFAPHYDDIEAFILQIEGKKRWKLYAARNQNEVLPRFSSRNFSEETDNLGEPILDVVLEEGDLLYFPRGVIHQAQTVDGEHSLHITLSCNQLNTYGDLLKHHLNHALDKLIAKDVSFRKGLPTDYLSFMGIAHENTSDSELKKKRSAFSKNIQDLVTKLAKEPADFASDAMGKKFIWDSLPPYLSSKERETTVVEDGEFMQNGRVFNRVEFGPETKVKFIRKNCVRLVVEEEQIKLYFSSENPLVYHEESEPQFLELSVELAPALNHLISQYPKYTKIEDLPISSNDIGQKIQVVSDLWERGLLFTKEPLEPCDYDDFESGDSDGENDQTTDANNASDEADEEDVESINLSDLPEEGEGEDEDEFTDDFYDTTMGMDSDDGSGSDDDEDDDEMYGFVDDEDNSEENDSEEFDYGVDEDKDPDLDEEEDDDDDDDEEDDDGFDFDALDRMGESDDDDDDSE